MLEVDSRRASIVDDKNREIETLYDMVTINPALAMNLDNHSIKVGAPANLVVLQTPMFWKHYASTRATSCNQVVGS